MPAIQTEKKILKVLKKSSVPLSLNSIREKTGANWESIQSFLESKPEQFKKTETSNGTFWELKEAKE